MKISIGAMAVSGAIIWGGSVLGVSLANLATGSYGREFLRMLSSIYPGYDGRQRGRSVAVGALYAAADGAIGGALTALLYNAISGCIAAAEVRPAPTQMVVEPKTGTD